MDQGATVKLDQFFSGYRKLRYKRGELMIRIDEDSLPFVFYLKKGYVRQFAISEKAEEITLNIFGPQSYFPLKFFIDRIENHYAFEAMTDVFVYRAPQNKVLKFVKSDPGILCDLAVRISTSLVDKTSIIENTMVSTVRHKVLAGLIILGCHFGQRKNNKLTINLSVTQKCIASLIGVSRETVCREAEKLRKEGIIFKDHKTLTINNVNLVEKELLL